MSTRVDPPETGVKRTSTSLDFARSGSYSHFRVIYQAITNRRGGSHARTLPQSQSVPSICSE